MKPMKDQASKIRVIVFPGIQNLPHYAAIDQGYYAKHQIQVDVHFTQSSQEQRQGLADKHFDLAHSAVDNALEMVLHANLDIQIVIGLDQAFNQLVTQPGIKTYSDLIGKTLGVDAPDTAFALVAYEMLKLHGITPGQYKILEVGATSHRLRALQEGTIDFSLLTLPFNLLAKDAGLSFLDCPLDAIGTYQSTGGFVHAPWGKTNALTLSRYLAAYIEGLRFVLNPKNQSSVVTLIENNLKLSKGHALTCYAQVTHPLSGFFKDAKFNLEGFNKVLELRRKFESHSSAHAPNVFYDERYYQSALELI
jgi:ABC-type nitrate/sulfonate/bicarbonate transport system substrate-binding protein